MMMTMIVMMMMMMMMMIVMMIMMTMIVMMMMMVMMMIVMTHRDFPGDRRRPLAHSTPLLPLLLHANSTFITNKRFLSFFI